MSLLIIYISTLNTYAIDIQIGIQDNSPVDIILTGGDTDFDYEGFAEKLTAELVAAGVAEDRINITASEVVTVSSKGSGAQEIISTWKIFPITGGGFAVGDNNKLFAPNAEHLMGFVDPKFWDSTGKLKMSMKIATTNNGQTMGFAFKVHPVNGIVTDTAEYNFYFVGLATSFPQDRPVGVGLFKITSYDMFSSRHSGDGGPVPHSYKFYREDDPQVGDWAMCTRNLGGYYYQKNLEILADAEILGTWPSGSEKLLEIEYSSGNIKVYVDGVKYIDFTDPQPFNAGTYGFSNISNLNSYYRDVEIEVGAITPLVDAVRSGSWQNTSNRFIIDVCDVEREDFQDPAKFGELVQRMQGNDAYYIGWGRQSLSSPETPSKASMELFIQRNDGKGIFFDNTNQNIYRDTANYIEPIVNNRQALDGRVYLYKDKDYLFTQD